MLGYSEMFLELVDPLGKSNDPIQKPLGYCVGLHSAPIGFENNVVTFATWYDQKATCQNIQVF